MIYSIFKYANIDDMITIERKQYILNAILKFLTTRLNLRKKSTDT